MSASTVKGDRKREIGQSPIKKKFRDSTISREDIDEAIANGIKLAFKEQQSTLDSVVTSAVRDAVGSVLIPALRKLREDIQATNNSVKELREEFEAMAAAAKQTRDRVDSVQATAREDRNAVTDLRNQLERLTEKMTDMEDKSRRNNVRLVGLPEGMEGSDVAGILRINLSKWIPSLKGRNIEIDRAHRVYDGRKKSDRPRTLTFRVDGMKDWRFWKVLGRLIRTTVVPVYRATLIHTCMTHMHTWPNVQYNRSCVPVSPHIKAHMHSRGLVIPWCFLHIQKGPPPPPPLLSCSIKGRIYTAWFKWPNSDFFLPCGTDRIWPTTM